MTAMFDSAIRPLIDPVLNKVASKIKTAPLKAGHITITGFLLGLIACICAMNEAYIAAVIFIILNRLADGLDGPLARIKGQESDFGGYCDIVCDFIIYAAFPVSIAYGLGTQEAAIAAAILIVSFMGTGTSFLAYAIICAKNKIETDTQGKKSFYYSRGLIEGTETIVFMIIIALFPQYFVWLAFTFTGLCFLTTAQRVMIAKQTFG
jgi:phosphatidylserine synthase